MSRWAAAVGVRFRRRLRAGRFRAKTVDAPNPPQPIWSALWERAGLSDRIDRVALEMYPKERTFRTNFNGGLYVIPGAAAEALGQLWERWARFCLQQADLLGEYLHHSDQLGMGLALAESGIAIDPLPAGANLPIHLEKRLLTRIRRQQVSAIHYHRHVERHGLPRDVGIPWIDTAIRRVWRSGGLCAAAGGELHGHRRFRASARHCVGEEAGLDFRGARYQ